MPKPKRHHFVPRFILANFADDRGRLWVRSLASGRIWHAAPEDVYVEQHRYSTIERDGTRDVKLEVAYSLLEGAAKPVFESMMAAARTGDELVLIHEQRLIWEHYFYHQWKRVPAVMNRLTAEKSWEERFEDAIADLVADGVRFDDAMLAEMRSPESLARFVQNAKVRALSTPPGVMARIMLGTSALGMAVTTGGSAFVIGDRPIANADEGLASGAPMWFPIAPDVAVRPIFDSDDDERVSLSGDEVAVINAKIAAQSEYVAGAARALIESVRAD